MLYKMELPNLSKAGISRREKTGHGSSLWLKNRAAGCQHPFQHQKCFISIWKTTPPQKEHHRRSGDAPPPFCPICPHKCSLLFGIYQLPTEEKWQIWTPSVRQTQTSSLSLLLWDDRPHCCSMREKSCSALSGNGVYSFSCGWVQVCSNSHGSGHLVWRGRKFHTNSAFDARTASQLSVLAWQPKECGFGGNPCILCKVYDYISSFKCNLYAYKQEGMQFPNPQSLT